jgi:hypothetical protein
MRLLLALLGAFVALLYVTLYSPSSSAINDADVTGSFGDPIPGLSPGALQDLEGGRQTFLRRFTRSEGAGPHFNATSCASCHEDPVEGGSSQRYRDFFLAVETQLDGTTKKVYEECTSDNAPVAQTQLCLPQHGRAALRALRHQREPGGGRGGARPHSRRGGRRRTAERSSHLRRRALPPGLRRGDPVTGGCHRCRRGRDLRTCQSDLYGGRRHRPLRLQVPDSEHIGLQPRRAAEPDGNHHRFFATRLDGDAPQRELVRGAPRNQDRVGSDRRAQG